MKEEATVLGIDLGGTKIAFAVSPVSEGVPVEAAKP